MGLVNATTNLKSLRFGKDRPGGGSSNQPYIKSTPPDSISDLGTTGGPDFLLRGGTLTPGRIFDDGSRLTKMFTDTKSPNGLLFTAKQNILSRTAVAKNGDGKALNEGAYLPTSTILGAAGNPIGLHLNKQGLNPLKGIAGDDSPLNFLNEFDPLGNPFYTELVKKDSNSRLEKYLKESILGENLGNLYEYSGGPNSILGIGKTKIPLAKDRTGKNNPNLTPSEAKITWSSKIAFQFDNRRFDGLSDINPTTNSSRLFNNSFNINSITNEYRVGTTGKTSYTTFKNPSITQREPATSDEDLQDKINNDQFYRLGASVKYASLNLIQSNITTIKNSWKNDGKIKLLTNVYGDFKDGTKGNLLEETDRSKLNNNSLSYKEISSQPQRVKEGRSDIIDFRNPNSSNPLYNSGSLRLEGRVNLGTPGNKSLKNRAYDYNPQDQTDADKKALDKITSYPLYKSDSGGTDQSEELNDLVKFRIGVIDNENPNKKTYIHFRAFLDSMSDDYSAQWDSQKFMGRGENFYKYNGFDRKISLGWTVAAQSKGELIPMYHKLNYLASTLAPDYSESGYMRGNLATLTVGGYLYEQPGIITSINYTVPQESPWEIAIDTGGGSDENVKELPHIIRVTGFNFIPIHNFTPKLQNNDYNGDKGKVSSYGKERYIALSKGGEFNNYDSNNYIPKNQTSQETTMIVGDLSEPQFESPS